MRARLRAVSSLPLTATVVFDHATPIALADYMHAQMQNAGPSAGANGSAPNGSLGEAERSGTIGSLLRHAHTLGMTDDFMGMLMGISAFMPTFDEGSELDAVSKPTRLAKGALEPELICLPSLIATGGPHQYARFAAAFSGSQAVSALTLPGFHEGELLPQSASIAVQALAAAVQRHAAAAPFALVGHSTGGLLAHAVAAHLERAGVPVTGLVLVDTYPFQSPILAEIRQGVMDEMLEQGHTHIPLADARLVAMGVYLRLFGEWLPEAIAAPTLLIRASEPLASVRSDRDWKSPWSLADAVEEAPGDHFTMMEEHADVTARVAQEWLLSVRSPI